MERTFEATIEKRDKWYIGWVDAVPGAFSQGRTIREVQENLKEAVQLILESQSELKDEATGGKILKRKIQVQVWPGETPRSPRSYPKSRVCSASRGCQALGLPESRERPHCYCSSPQGHRDLPR